MSQLLDALAGVTNAYEPLPGLVTGGQPELGHLAALKRAGCDSVIDTRDPMEPQPFDAPRAIVAAGLAYVNIPVSHTPEDDHPIEALRRALADEGRAKRWFIYCNSGNRVGAALIPYFMLDRGMTEEDAVNAALRIGTRQSELLEWGLAYVRRRATG